MRKYLVSGTGKEQLKTMEILAKSPEEAREVLYDLWMNGQTHGIGYELCDVDIRDGGEHLYTYLAKFSLRDGEHEYRAEFLVQAANYDEAFSIAKSQEHEPTIPDDDEEDKLSCWDYGDGTTAARLDGVVEISDEEAHLLRRLGLAFDFN